MSSKVIWICRDAQWLTTLAALPEDGLGFDAHTGAHTISILVPGDQMPSSAFLGMASMSYTDIHQPKYP